MGFYYNKIKQDDASTVGIIINGKEWRAPLTSGLSITTNIEWDSGGNLMNAFTEGIAKGANQAMDVSRDVQNTMANLGNRITKSTNGGTSFNGAEQGKLIAGGGDYYLKYNSSKTEINLPSLTFQFINEDDTDKVLNEVKEFLECLLPLVSEMSNDDFRYETPPNNFQTPNQGFDPSGITGSVSVRIGTRTVKYFVPANVNINVSPDCSLEDNKIPQYVDVSVLLRPAYKYMSPEVFDLFK